MAARPIVFDIATTGIFNQFILERLQNGVLSIRLHYIFKVRKHGVHTILKVWKINYYINQGSTDFFVVWMSAAFLK